MKAMRFNSGLRLRQQVGLLVPHHLDPMLDVAQKPIGFRQFRRSSRSSIHLRLGEFGERLLGRAAAQLRHAAAGDQLLGLHEELDLADAAAPELDVVALDRDGAVTLVHVDLPLDRMDVGDGRIVEILAEDEGHEVAQEGGPGFAVAADGAGLDEGGALPVLPSTLVVDHRRIDGDRERRRARIGP